MLLGDGLELSERWATRRPEELTPEEFIELTTELYGPAATADSEAARVPIWRAPLKGAASIPSNHLDDLEEEEDDELA